MKPTEPHHVQVFIGRDREPTEDDFERVAQTFWNGPVEVFSIMLLGLIAGMA